MIKTALAIVFVCATATPTYAVSAASLLASCEALDHAVQGTDGSLSFPAIGMTCFHYMEALQDSLVLADVPGHPLLRACPPPTSRLTDLVHAFTAYARRYQTHMTDSAASFALHAFREAYPCSR